MVEVSVGSSGVVTVTAVFIAFSLMFGGMAGLVTYGLLTILLARWLPAPPPKREVDDETVILLIGGGR